MLLSFLFLISANSIAAKEDSFRLSTEAYGRIKTNPLGVRQPIDSSSVTRRKQFEPWPGPLTDTPADG